MDTEQPGGIPPPPEGPQQPPQVIYQVVQQRATNGMAVAGLVLGILGVFIPFLGILALIFAGIGMSKANDNGGSGKGMAIAGLVLGIVGTLVTLYILGNIGSSSSSYSY